MLRIPFRKNQITKLKKKVVEGEGQSGLQKSYPLTNGLYKVFTGPCVVRAVLEADLLTIIWLNN